MIYRFLALLALLSCTVTPARAGDGSISVSYSGYSHGLKLLDLNSIVALTSSDYHVQITYRVAGLIGVLVSGDGNTTVEGHFVSNHVEPQKLVSSGDWQGDARATEFKWQGGAPQIIQLIPPLEPDRQPVALKDQAHTVDALSGMALLVRQVTDTGHCDGTVRTFDGRRLAQVTAHTVGDEKIEETDRSSFHGSALRCDYEWQQLGGFREDDDQEVKKVRQGSAWLARLAPNQPLLPVRIVFTTKLLGDTTLYINQDTK